MQQRYAVRRRDIGEHEWSLLPGWRAATAAYWESAQWQRVNCVKNIRQLRTLMGDLLDERFYADLERDQAERATESMLVTPQMLNTMVDGFRQPMPDAGHDFTEAFFAVPVRSYLLPVFTDRRADSPSQPHPSRCSLHEPACRVA